MTCSDTLLTAMTHMLGGLIDVTSRFEETLGLCQLVGCYSFDQISWALQSLSQVKMVLICSATVEPVQLGSAARDKPVIMEAALVG